MSTGRVSGAVLMPPVTVKRAARPPNHPDEVRCSAPGAATVGRPMLHLRVFGAAPMMERVAESVSALDGADHVTRTSAGDGAGRALVTADVDPDAADAALHVLTGLGVPTEDVWLL